MPIERLVKSKRSIFESLWHAKCSPETSVLLSISSLSRSRPFPVTWGLRQALNLPDDWPFRAVTARPESNTLGTRVHILDPP